MKSSNEVRLGLEVLEDRLALSGAFVGAIDAGPPSLTPFPYNGMTVQVATAQPQIWYRGSPFSYLTFAQAPSLQSQLQAFQAAQTALIDQYFSEVQALVQLWHLNTYLII